MTFKIVPIVKLAAVVLGLAMSTSAWAVTTVDVTGDGTYDDATLTVDVYANIVPETAADMPIVSAGVTLNYDPSQLTLQNAVKNEAVWYFGPVTAPFPYIDPDNIDDGSIEFIVGKLDTADPLAGVTGNVKIGTATFTYPAGSSMPATPASLTMGYARNGNYENFVTTDQTALDVNPSMDNTDPVQFGAVSLAQACVLEADLNSDGRVNIFDFNILSSEWLQSGAGLAGDINGDGRVNIFDFNILSSEWLQSCP